MINESVCKLGSGHGHLQSDRDHVTTHIPSTMTLTRSSNPYYGGGMISLSGSQRWHTYPDDPSAVVAACESDVMHIHHNVKPMDSFWVKAQPYSPSSFEPRLTLLFPIFHPKTTITLPKLVARQYSKLSSVPYGIMWNAQDPKSHC